MTIKEYINTIIGLTLVLFLFFSAYLVKPEFFNGIVTGKQYGLELAALCVAGYLVFFLPFRKSIRVTRVDAGIIILCLWYLLGEIINGFPFISIEHVVFSIGLWMSAYLFTRQSSGKPVFIWGVIFIWLVVTLVQALMGLMQLHGKAASHHYLFNITGTFHNPGPFAGFIISALPLALGIVLALKQVGYSGTKDRNLKLWKWQVELHDNAFYLLKAMIFLCYTVIVTLLLVVPAAHSRAAWIAGVAGSAYVLWKHPFTAGLRDKLTSLISSMSFFTRLTVIIFAFILLLPVGMGLYLIKPGSASGRVLMWQVTWEVVKEKPLFGHGTGSFNALYMPAQARWFESGKGTEAQVMVAGSPQAPFNEPLGLWLEKGLVGILLASGILFLIFYSRPGRFDPGGKSQPGASGKQISRDLERSNQFHISSGNPEHDTVSPNLAKAFLSEIVLKTIKVALEGALLSMLVFGLFSYPFDISSFILQLAVVTALLGGFSKTAFVMTGPAKLSALRPGLPVAAVLLALIVYNVPHRVNHYEALKTWRNAEKLYKFRSYNASAIEYEKAFPVLSGNGLFLQMYGKALSMDEQHQRSIRILNLAANLYNSHILQNTLGDSYKALGNYEAAEAAYIESSQMMPSMLLPRYLLAKLYHDSGENEKARQTAKDVLNSPVKVESSATREIIGEMDKIIRENSE